MSTARHENTPTERPAKRQMTASISEGASWWRAAQVDPVDASMGQDHDCSVERQTRPTFKLNMLPVQEATADPVTTDDVPPAQDQPAAYDHTAADPPTDPVEILQELSKHYLEALYLSRTSLAYFAKGPLSRARAAFTRSDAEEQQVNPLATSLRNSILSASTLDKKYKEHLSAFVKDLPPAGAQTPERGGKAKKRRRKWKPKRDKHGLFVDEEEYVERWWYRHDDAGSAPASGETLDAALRRRVPYLRSRETYLQTILALEVLALEAATDRSYGDVTTRPAESPVKCQLAVEQLPLAEARKQKPKAKKTQDLPALLEVLLDRLCIWHSLETHSPAKHASSGQLSPENASSDELRDFCIEVVVPFYLSRLPEHAATVNKKLGGPSAPTPAKRKPSAQRRPGEPAMRPPPEKKARRPLARIATDNLEHITTAVPSLQRSATDSDVLQRHLKREASETPTPLDLITAAAKPHQRRRTNLMQSIGLTKREVDLTAMSQVTDAKLRKKADMDEKLRDAITAIKKPNRAVAVKEVAEHADLAFAKTLVKNRPAAKSKSTSRLDVHIAATPKQPKATRPTPKRHVDDHAVAHPSSTSTSFIPSSTVKTSQPPHRSDASEASSAVPQTVHRPRHAPDPVRVEDTPSRGFAKFMPTGLIRIPGTLESPIATRQAAMIEQTPVKPVRSLSFANAALVEASPNPVRAQLSPPQPVAGASGGDQTIYKSLGWDDEYEELA